MALRAAGFFKVPISPSLKVQKLHLPLQRNYRSNLHAFEKRMETSSYPLIQHDVTVSAPYKKETVGGCDIYHRNLSYGNITIHFVECGNMDGKVVILVHGFPNFWFLWKNQFKALAEEGYHVIAPDLRGYNISSRPRSVKHYDQESVMCDLQCLVEYYSNNQNISMVGHDWGGCAVWALAETHPEKFKKIVTVNSPHMGSFRSVYQHSLRQRLRSWYIVFFQLPAIPEAFLRFNRFWALRNRGTSPLKNQPEEDINRYVEAYSSPGALTGMINYYRAFYAGYWENVGKAHISIPVKVIWGGSDSYLDRQLANPPENLVPNATVYLLPELSHWPMWDDPDLFNQALLKVLK